MLSLLAFWRRHPQFGVLAVLALVAITVGWGWNAVRVYAPIVRGEVYFITDFSYYYEAAERFVRGGVLYPDAFSFMYPPLSVFLFLPLLLLPESASFLVTTVGIAGVAAVCVELTLRLYEAGQDERIATPLRITLWLAGLAMAPVYQNLKYGQVNVLVLFFGLVFLWLLQRDRPFAAALVLSAGFWLKLYPIALCLLGLRRGWAARGAVGLGIGIVVAPLVALPLIPAEVYRHYVFDLIPFWSGASNMHALNQSLPTFLTRLALPLDAFVTSRDAPFDTLAKSVTTAATLLLFGGFYAAYFARRLRFDVVGVAVLAVLPVASALGWEYVYVLALPLVLYVLLEARKRSPWVQVLTTIAVFGWMIPKLPEPVMLWTFTHWPRPFVDAFYARFMLLTLVFLGAATAWLWGRIPKTNRASTT